MQKIALITGASSGIGAEAARELAGIGFQVILVARNETNLAEVAASIGPMVSFEACDAASAQEVLAMADRVRKNHGIPDVIINCAGAGQWKRIEDTSPVEAVAMIGAPYLAAFNVTHAFMRDMLGRRSGTILHINSLACYMAWPSSVGYTAARCALRGLHESLCQDLAGTGVQSCHIVFGKVDSGYFEHNPGTAANLPGIAKTIRTLSPVECGRVIAGVVARPRRETICPFMLRVFCWNNRFAPSLGRWLMRVTGARRVDVSKQ